LRKNLVIIRAFILLVFYETRKTAAYMGGNCIFTQIM